MIHQVLLDKHLQTSNKNSKICYHLVKIVQIFGDPFVYKLVHFKNDILVNVSTKMNEKILDEHSQDESPFSEMHLRKTSHQSFIASL